MSDLLVRGLRATRDGDFLRVTLARPERRNAIDGAMIDTLDALFRDPGDVRGIVLCGEGGHFSAGADLDWMHAANTEHARLEQSRKLAALLDAIESCAAPVLADVQGYCLGAACGLVAASDISVASHDAVFAFPEVKYGLVPAVVAPFVVRRTVAGHARRYLVTGERFSAERAAAIGLVGEISDSPEPLKPVLEELSSAAPRASRLAKELALARVADDRQPELMAEVRSGEEAEEGVAASRERRKPSWA